MNENYSLYLGDCLEIMPQLIEEDVKVDLILTDPPYGVSGCKWDNVLPFSEMWAMINGLSKQTTPSVLFGTEPFSSGLRVSNMKHYKYDWIWEKSIPASFGIAKYQPMRYHEMISVFYKKAGQYYKQMIPRTSPRIKQAQKTNYVFKTGHNELIANGAKNISNPSSKFNPDWKNPSSILKFHPVQSNSKEKVPHPTQKPVKLLEYLIKTYTLDGDTVLDFTMGSGSTGVACMNLNRKFIGIELEEKYYNIAEQRLMEATHSKQTTLI